ncbi:hypothetical protein Bhz59_00069 [Stenotrophomonas phage vB_SmaS_Bhz59]
MNKINDLTAKFDTLKPGLAKDFEEFVTKELTRIVAENPTRDAQSKLANSWGRDGNLFRAFRGLLAYAPSATYQMTPAVGPDAERVTKAAKSYADDQVAKFTMKLVRKLGDLTNVEIRDIDMGGFQFLITGQLGERKVSVQQNRIINCSVNGNLFHQWPALIYVDGVKTSEAAFKKLAP